MRKYCSRSGWWLSISSLLSLAHFVRFSSLTLLRSNSQANPLHVPRTTLKITSHTRPGILAANWPLIVPMRLRISNLVLRGITVLVVDKHKGVTLVFKNDPLEKVDVNSTFDNIPNIRRFLQTQIEDQLRKMFQEDLPALIHNLSLVYLKEKKNGGGSMIPSEQHTSFTPSPDTPKEHDEISSLDSGYHSDTPISVPSRETPRTPREKWLGNSLDDQDDDAWVHGYTFYRNLSASSGALDMGFKSLSIPKPLTSDRVVLKERLLAPTLAFDNRWGTVSDPGPGRWRRNSVLSQRSTTSSLGPLSHHVRAGFAGYQNFSTRPRIPPRARSVAALDILVSYGRDSAWDVDHDADLESLEQGCDATSLPPRSSPPITLHPTTTPLAAHLANLISSNHTISPLTQTTSLPHTTLRTNPKKVSQTTPPPPINTSFGRRWRDRKVNRITLPPGVVIPKAMISPGLGERMVEMGLAPPPTPGSRSSGSSERRRREKRGVGSVKSDEGRSVRSGEGLSRTRSVNGLVGLGRANSSASDGSLPAGPPSSAGSGFITRRVPTTPTRSTPIPTRRMSQASSIVSERSTTSSRTTTTEGCRIVVTSRSVSVSMGCEGESV